MAWLEKLLRSKAFIVLLIVLPGFWPAWPFFIRPNPGVLADPPKYLLLHLGLMASVLLAAVLALTPLRVLFPQWRPVLALNRHRRLVGVSAFVYGALHFTMHLLYERSLAVLATDIEKPFLVTGMIALAILTALAVTSLHAVVRRMGGRNWKRLHRLAYVAAALVIYHQSAARKVFPVQVLWIFVPLAVLELGRVYRTLAVRRKTED